MRCYWWLLNNNVFFRRCCSCESSSRYIYKIYLRVLISQYVCNEIGYLNGFFCHKIHKTLSISPHWFGVAWPLTAECWAECYEIDSDKTNTEQQMCTHASFQYGTGRLRVSTWCYQVIYNAYFLAIHLSKVGVFILNVTKTQLTITNSLAHALTQTYTIEPRTSISVNDFSNFYHQYANLAL